MPRHSPRFHINLYRTVQVMTDVRHDQLLGSIGTNPRLLIELTP